MSNSDATVLARDVIEATPRCATCGHFHYIAEIDIFRGGLVLMGMRCSECRADILAAYLAVSPDRAKRRGGGWVSRAAVRSDKSSLAASLAQTFHKVRGSPPKVGGA